MLMKLTPEQQAPVNNDHYFWVARMFVVNRFNCGLISITQVSSRISTDHRQILAKA